MPTSIQARQQQSPPTPPSRISGCFPRTLGARQPLKSRFSMARFSPRPLSESFSETPSRDNRPFLCFFVLLFLNLHPAAGAAWGELGRGPPAPPCPGVEEAGSGAAWEVKIVIELPRKAPQLPVKRIPPGLCTDGFCGGHGLAFLPGKEGPDPQWGP